MSTNKTADSALESLTRLMAYDRSLSLRKLPAKSRAYSKGYRWQIIGTGKLCGRVNMVAPDLQSAGDMIEPYPYHKESAMHTAIVVIVYTESNEYNELTLLDFGVWKETGETRQAVHQSIERKMRSAHVYNFSYRIYDDPPGLPDDLDLIQFPE